MHSADLAIGKGRTVILVNSDPDERAEYAQALRTAFQCEVIEVPDLERLYLYPLLKERIAKVRDAADYPLLLTDRDTMFNVSAKKRRQVFKGLDVTAPVEELEGFLQRRGRATFEKLHVYLLHCGYMASTGLFPWKPEVSNRRVTARQSLPRGWTCIAALRP